MTRRLVVAVLVASVLAGAVLGPSDRTSADPAGPPTYRPPLVAPVADPFRPPPQSWLPGNRGIEYATAPGSGVGAIGPGVVTFAGLVAGERDVTVQHPDGLRSSYVDLAVVLVAAGERVAAGQLLGRTTERLHLGVRRGDRYLDPASLWDRPVAGGRVVLVPLADDVAPRAGVPPPAAVPAPARRLTAGDLVGPALAVVVARSLAPG